MAATLHPSIPNHRLLAGQAHHHHPRHQSPEFIEQTSSVRRRNADSPRMGVRLTGGIRGPIRRSNVICYTGDTELVI